MNQMVKNNKKNNNSRNSKEFFGRFPQTKIFFLALSGETCIATLSTYKKSTKSIKKSSKILHISNSVEKREKYQPETIGRQKLSACFRHFRREPQQLRWLS